MIVIFFCASRFGVWTSRTVMSSGGVDCNVMGELVFVERFGVRVLWRFILVGLGYCVLR